MASQNIYDDPEFFTGYASLARSQHGLNGAPEWPSLAAMLPDLAGLKVLDLGCGYGWFCRYASQAGAESVTGMDLSRKMLDKARSYPDQPGIRYRQADLEELTLEPGTYGLVFSSLAFHYISGMERLLGEIRQALRPGGRLVFSVEHPVYTAIEKARWLKGPDGPVWPVSCYADEGERLTDWIRPGVRKQHRRISTWFRLLRDAGFGLRTMDEWAPDSGQVAAEPDLAVERMRPMFLLMGCQAE